MKNGVGLVVMEIKTFNFLDSSVCIFITTYFNFIIKTS